MIRREKLAIAKIYVPVKRHPTLKPGIVRRIAVSIHENGQATQSRFGAMTNASSSWRVGTGWRRARHWASCRSLGTLYKPKSIRLTRTDEANEIHDAVERGKSPYLVQL
jgi:hypothetical protein